MAWRYHGHATTNRRNPDAYAICDRCGQQYNRSKLTWQFDWVGPRLMNLRILVCRACNDRPFEHNRPIVVPPDPVPVMNPRPDLYLELVNGPVLMQDTNLEPMYDTGGINILQMASLPILGNRNPPPSPDYDFYTLSSNGGGVVFENMTVPD